MASDQKPLETQSSRASALSVVCIGCGPGGMSILHALQLRKQKMDPTSPEYKALPEITCYERAPTPGGLWREVPEDDKERNRPENKKLQYEDLWLNNPKELIEYFDYTFDDHFQRPTPSYMPRRDTLEYIVARHSKDGALDNVHYNHTVLNVEFDCSLGKFVVTVRDDISGETTVKNFDRCIHACGANDKAKEPSEIVDVLKGFSGKYYHSVEATDCFEEDVKGKKLMLIGGSNSAEDLTLRALKLGVEHVYICARNFDGDAMTMGSYPYGKVTRILGLPYEVKEGNSFKCCNEDEDDIYDVEKIDTVIMCTGYTENLSMVEENLRFDPSAKWAVSDGWNMKENVLSPFLGTVTPSTKLKGGYTLPFHELYDTMLISNPWMMYMHETGDSPLFELEIDAWIVLTYLTGEREIPSKAEMIKTNQEELEAEMQEIWGRYAMDREYRDAVTEMYESSDGPEWLGDNDDERYIALYTDMYREFCGKHKARLVKKAKYPIDFGDRDSLSDIGQHFAQLMFDSAWVRKTVEQDDADDTGLTFRDTFLKDFVSILTGTPSTPLPGRWLNLKAVGGEPTKLSTLKDVSMP